MRRQNPHQAQPPSEPVIGATPGRHDVTNHTHVVGKDLREGRGCTEAKQALPPAPEKPAVAERQRGATAARPRCSQASARAALPADRGRSGGGPERSTSTCWRFPPPTSIRAPRPQLPPRAAPLPVASEGLFRAAPSGGELSPPGDGGQWLAGLEVGSGPARVPVLLTEQRCEGEARALGSSGCSRS